MECERKKDYEAECEVIREDCHIILLLFLVILSANMSIFDIHSPILFSH